MAPAGPGQPPQIPSLESLEMLGQAERARVAVEPLTNRQQAYQAATTPGGSAYAIVSSACGRDEDRTRKR